MFFLDSQHADMHLQGWAHVFWAHGIHKESQPAELPRAYYGGDLCFLFMAHLGWVKTGQLVDP